MVPLKKLRVLRYKTNLVAEVIEINSVSSRLLYNIFPSLRAVQVPPVISSKLFYRLRMVPQRQWFPRSHIKADIIDCFLRCRLMFESQHF